MFSVGIVISLIGVLKFLLAVAVLVCLILGLKYLAGLLGWSPPQPLWAVLGFIFFILLLIYALQGGEGVVLR